MNGEYIDNLNIEIQKELLKPFHNKIVKRISMIEYITNNDILFKINDTIIKDCSKKIEMDKSEIKKVIQYYIDARYFVKVKSKIEKDLYKIGDSYLNEEEKIKRRNAIAYFRKHNFINYY